MTNNISRRDFLKLSLLGLLGAGFTPRPHARDIKATYPGLIGRITTNKNMAPIYAKPSLESDIVRETIFDELLHLYYEVTVKTEEGEDDLWYRVWGGYLHKTYVQRTYYRFNKPLHKIPECGQLAEVTVPYTQAYTKKFYEGWKKTYRLYYSSNHWITGLETGPDGQLWYQITSEISETLIYYVPREHLRPIPDAELAPISLNVPEDKKRIEISLAAQTLTAYEYDKPVLHALVSSGLPAEEVPPVGTRTPTGQFRVTTKMPTKHMGIINFTEETVHDTYPGVPWATFFIFETGVAIHGTYWHDNFGNKMSHGCINMRNEDAKWLFLWTTPLYDPPYRDHCNWDVRGHGTKIIVRW